MTLATINAIWIGSRLGDLHVACLRSFLRHGHRVVLHVYDEPQDTPFGVALADASKFLPRSRIFRNRKAVFRLFLICLGMKFYRQV